MTNSRITPAAILDINALIPRRCPNFIATMHATIDNYFDDPDNPISDADRKTISDTLIELRF